MQLIMLKNGDRVVVILSAARGCCVQGISIWVGAGLDALLHARTPERQWVAPFLESRVEEQQGPILTGFS